jgi:hypothetical protein
MRRSRVDKPFCFMEMVSLPLDLPALYSYPFPTRHKCGSRRKMEVHASACNHRAPNTIDDGRLGRPLVSNLCLDVLHRRTVGSWIIHRSTRGMFFRVPAPHASNWVWHTGEGLQCPQPLQVPRYMIHTLHPLELAPLYLSSLPVFSLVFDNLLNVNCSTHT